MMANLLFWLEPDKLCFGSDYAIWSPQWLIDQFMAYEIPDDLQQEYQTSLTLGDQAEDSRGKYGPPVRH